MNSELQQEDTSQCVMHPEVAAAKHYSPTLIELYPATHQHLFKSIHRSVRPDDTKFSRYVESKCLCIDTYNLRGYEYEMSMFEEHDGKALILYSLDQDNQVDGTLRICIDSQIRLPIADSLPEEYPQFRQQGLALGEPGRFAINPESKNFRRFISAAYEIGIYCQLDAYLLQIRSEQLRFYKRFCAAELLSNEHAPPGCTHLIWRLDKTPALFLRVFGNHQSDLLKLINIQGDIQ